MTRVLRVSFVAIIVFCSGCTAPGGGGGSRTFAAMYRGRASDGSRALTVELQTQTGRGGSERMLVVSMLSGPPASGPANAEVRPRVWTIPTKNDPFRGTPADAMQGRWDRATGRMWLLDRANGRVVVSVDPSTGRAAGPDEAAPEWATATAGVALSRE